MATQPTTITQNDQRFGLFFTFAKSRLISANCFFAFGSMAFVSLICRSSFLANCSSSFWRWVIASTNENARQKGESVGQVPIHEEPAGLETA